MTDTTSERAHAPRDPRKPWHWHPDLPIGHPPLFDWPPRPLAVVRWLLGRGFLWSQHTVYILLALVAWSFFTPSLERMTTFEAGWIFEIWLRNIVMFSAATAGLHLYFYTFRRQGDVRKYDARPLATNDPKFLFRDQLLDNVFWSLVSGVTIWTAFEAAIWWFWANGLVGWLPWADNPVWFAALFPLVALFETAHFYAIHRLIHWKPLYRFHALHHNNVNVGPWSGISMHPVEHVFYLSSILIHLVVASHPLHMLYHGFFLTVGASFGHTGYNDVQIKGRNVFDVANLFHQLHHRYYHCNYGQTLAPLDKWFGSFHDGTPEATERILKAARHARLGGKPAV